jgi:hypothetical protein
MSALFPVLVELSGRECLVVGGSALAEAKIQSLLASGASVRVVAPQGTALVEKWARARKIAWEKRSFQPGDLKSTFFVVAATSLEKTNAQVLQEAKKRRVLCTTAETPNRCDFHLLLEWLPQVQDPYIKETIVRALSVPSARPFAGPVLVEEFRKAAPTQMLLKLAIGNALSVVADDSVCDEIIELALDRKHGKARQLLVLTLANMQDPRAAETAMKLLHDDMVAGHAIMALGRLKAKRSRSLLKPFLHHRRAWVRREAQKAVQRIDGSIAPRVAAALPESNRQKRPLRHVAKAAFKLRRQA